MHAYWTAGGTKRRFAALDRTWLALSDISFRLNGSKCTPGDLEPWLRSLGLVPGPSGASVSEPHAEERDDLQLDTTLSDTSYESDVAALSELSTIAPEVDELVFVGYSGRMFVHHLTDVPKWRISRMRLLLTDWGALDPDLPGTLPRDGEWIERKREDIKSALVDLNGLVRSRFGVKDITVHYMRGHPLVRLLLLDGEVGFFRFYARRVGKPLDFATRTLPVLRLSKDTPYQAAIINQFRTWFEFVWENGSYDERSRRRHMNREGDGAQGSATPAG